MATKKSKTAAVAVDAVDGLSLALGRYAIADAARAVEHTLATPANRRYIFAKNCTNDHGHFAKGDKARGAFSPGLVDSYVAAGVLVEVMPRG